MTHTPESIGGHIADTMGKAGVPLTSNQRMVLIASSATWFSVITEKNAKLQAKVDMLERQIVALLGQLAKAQEET